MPRPDDDELVIVARHYHAALNKVGTATTREQLVRECEALDERDRKTTMVFDGLVFVYPFVCLCCGIQVNANQWAYGRACGRCDAGKCTCDTNRPRKTISPHVRRFIDGEVVQIDVRDMMNLRIRFLRTP